MSNFNKADYLFLNYLAPTLCGIKPANLFTLTDSDFTETDIKYWESKLKNQNLNLSVFKITENRWMILAYDLVWIRQILSDDLVQAYLRGKNYRNPLNTTQTLNELFYRLQNQTGFPHEVGLFLGYPIEDVMSFEQNQGHNCKYCGYWKSYCNPEEAKKCCAQYKQCSQMCKQWFEEGLTVPQIIKKYKKAVQTAA